MESWSIMVGSPCHDNIQLSLPSIVRLHAYGLQEPLHPTKASQGGSKPLKTVASIGDKISLDNKLAKSEAI